MTVQLSKTVKSDIVSTICVNEEAGITPGRMTRILENLLDTCSRESVMVNVPGPVTKAQTITLIADAPDEGRLIRTTVVAGSGTGEVILQIEGHAIPGKNNVSNVKSHFDHNIVFEQGQSITAIVTPTVDISNLVIQMDYAKGT
jgi:hypothetical protein